MDTLMDEQNYNQSFFCMDPRQVFENPPQPVQRYTGKELCNNVQKQRQPLANITNQMRAHYSEPRHIEIVKEEEFLMSSEEEEESSSQEV